MIVECPVTATMRTLAISEAETEGAFRGSFTAGQGTAAGYVAELCFMDYAGGIRVKANPDYDVIMGNLRVDVKATRRNVVPKLWYMCYVADWNPRQDCDQYAFATVSYDLTRCWLMGWLPKFEFFARSDFKREGDKDETGFVYPHPGYVVKASDLADVPRKEQRWIS